MLALLPFSFNETKSTDKNGEIKAAMTQPFLISYISNTKGLFF
ncbi:hypothetical protein QE396_004671 [Enterobacter sp. SORGH_AS 287]|jgi:hypothetical protein|nr:hypothetical protein [Enterobacter sp. SORGH_AS_0287]